MRSVTDKAVAVLCLGMLGCVPGGTGGGNGGGGSGGGDPGDAAVADDAGTVPDAAPCDLPASQGASEPCCLGLGIDACGAGLFCAAFDGRMQATCYLEGSRREGESCEADRHCAEGLVCPEGLCRAAGDQVGGAPCDADEQCLSAQCDPAAGCLGTLDGPCSPAAGCLWDAGGPYVYCDPGAARCLASAGDAGDRCAEEAHCQGLPCVDGRCTAGGPEDVLLALLGEGPLVMAGDDIPSEPNGFSEDIDLGPNTQCYHQTTLSFDGRLVFEMTLGELRDGVCDRGFEGPLRVVTVENHIFSGDLDCFDVDLLTPGFGWEGRGRFEGAVLRLELYFSGQASGQRCADGPVGAPGVVLNGSAFAGDAVQVYRPEAR